MSDDCSDLTKADVAFGHATSDEPDDDRGDGNTHADVQFSNGCRTAAVRAERSGPGDGRVYELTLDVADEAGNHPAVPQVFTVAVPHDRAHGAGDDGDAETYECADALSTCRSTPVVCTGAGSGDVDLRASRKGPSLRWRSSGFPAGGISAQHNLLCAYVDGVAVGGSLAPDKVRVKDKKGEGSLSVKTRGDDLELPLPLASGATLRLELRDGAGNCVSYDEVVE